jgi:hypothetical protein
VGAYSGKKAEGARIDSQTIGETAGEVWQYLKEHGGTSLTTLVRAIGALSEAVLMAVGWLARAGKLELSQEKRSVHVRLVEK